MTENFPKLIRADTEAQIRKAREHWAEQNIQKLRRGVCDFE